MMLSGAAHRYWGGSGAAAERLVLPTFHHSCAVPSGEVQMRFQSKGFSLVETAFTGHIKLLRLLQGVKMKTSSFSEWIVRTITIFL